MRVKLIRPYTKIPRLLANAELVFDDGGPLHGLRLVGFGIWEEHDDKPRSVTFPSRPNKGKNYWLLRAIEEDEQSPVFRLREVILRAYKEWGGAT